MSNLSAKLKALGVQLGARDLPPPKPPEEKRALHSIEQVVEGRLLTSAAGACFVVESRYDASYRHGDASLHTPWPLSRVAQWANADRIAASAREAIVFLDTETTGLVGGTGTLPFMIGAGRFSDGQFKVAQFFMRDPSEEAAALTALEEWLAPCQTMVTFNGKAFDVPLLKSRYTLQQRAWPVAEAAQLDLLPLARRLWRDRLPSRALGALERDILRATRTQEDAPGWLIPEMYFEYLRTGDARPLKGVFYHNAMDILAMAALLGHVAQMLDDPWGAESKHAADYVSLGKLYEGFGEYDLAVRAYERGLAGDLPNHLFSEAAQRLATLQRKLGQFEQTLELWREGAKRGEVYACIALAKYFEHQARDYEAAMQSTREAIALVRTKVFSLRERARLSAELQHRLERVQRKLTSVTDVNAKAA